MEKEIEMLRKKNSKRKWLALLLAIFSVGVIAAGIEIRGDMLPYSNLSSAGTGVSSTTAERINALTQAAGAYRTMHGSSTLPRGSTFGMRYQDGSSERGRVDSVMGTVGSTPIGGSQKCPNYDCGIDTQPF